MKSWKKPTSDQVDHAVALLGHIEQRRYFFDKLENPEWIEPLKVKGFFTNPLKPVHDEARGTIGFPPWPESRYLARMAALAPEQVLKVILQIPDTENIRVYEDLTDAALKMPPQLSAKLVEKAKVLAQLPYQMLLPEKLGSLVAHLARSGQAEAALDLARVLLEILPDPQVKEESEEEKKYSLPPEPKARFDSWHYEQILKKNIPELVKAAGIDALKLLCDKLETYVRLSRSRKDDQSPEDYSYIWRPAIEEHEQNRGHGINHALVKAVRDAAEQVAQSDPSRIPEIVQILESHPWKIFKRIALHVLRQLWDAAPGLGAERLINREMFDDKCIRHEYALLIGEHFNKLSPEYQKIILDWIEQGPALEQSKQPTPEEVARYREIWQLEPLSWIKKHLPEDWKKRYEEIVAKYGEPEHPEFASYSMGGWVGPTSPKTVEELQSMTVKEIAQLLKVWTPPDDLFAPSPEGLGRALSTVVSQNPEAFAQEACCFKGLDPTYVRSFLIGLRDAITQNHCFEWLPILELCYWVMEQPREIPGRPKRRNMDMDPDWGWTRKSIADLFSEGFKEGPGGIPIDARSTVWNILRLLTDDPDPIPEDEAQYGRANRDMVTLSINTTRGEAMHAVIRYALWVHRYLKTLPDGKELISRGFDEMPEIWDVLTLHLDVIRESSLAIRSVYGQWFPWLVLIDPNWAAANAVKIFPRDERQKDFFDAAWHTYIVYCNPYDNVFEVLREHYGYAIECLSSEKKGRSLSEPDTQLAEHLMTFYWRGKLNREETKGLLEQFWVKGGPKVRGHALNFIGRNLHDWPEVPAEILERLKILWEKRFQVAKVSTIPDSHRYEMAAFGWWFASGKFEDRWAMEQLLESLRIAGKTDWEDDVLEKLESIVQSMPKETVECLELMVRGDQEGWKIYGWQDHMKTILSKALQTVAASAAEDLIHYLGSRGYLEYGNLLKGRK